VKTNGKILSGRLVSNGQDIEGLNGAQRNELIVPGQNQWHFLEREGFSEFWQLINDAYISGLGIPEAFCSHF